MISCFRTSFSCFRTSFLNLINGVLLTKTCYYTENQGFEGATNQDMSLNETCFYSPLYSIWHLQKIFDPFVFYAEVYYWKFKERHGFLLMSNTCLICNTLINIHATTYFHWKLVGTVLCMYICNFGVHIKEW